MYIMAKSRARKSRKLRRKTIRGGFWPFSSSTEKTETTGAPETKPFDWSFGFGKKSEGPATTNTSNPIEAPNVEAPKVEAPKVEVIEPKLTGGKRRKRSKTSKK